MAGSMYRYLHNVTIKPYIEPTSNQMQYGWIGVHMSGQKAGTLKQQLKHPLFLTLLYPSVQLMGLTYNIKFFLSDTVGYRLRSSESESWS